jgi:hypothetical protein
MPSVFLPTMFALCQCLSLGWVLPCDFGNLNLAPRRDYSGQSGIRGLSTMYYILLSAARHARQGRARLWSVSHLVRSPGLRRHDHIHIYTASPASQRRTLTPATLVFPPLPQCTRQQIILQRLTSLVPSLQARSIRYMFSLLALRSTSSPTSGGGASSRTRSSSLFP